MSDLETWTHFDFHQSVAVSNIGRVKIFLEDGSYLLMPAPSAGILQNAEIRGRFRFADFAGPHRMDRGSADFINASRLAI